ncbi:tyrosine-type recombinase/integrase [Sulfitobacter sp. D7]|uniref:tyrosine-type recombinase/integrase n=1 Tax=Sulfitobacter sp. D7 TaxID=1968541 RepID=UPI0013C51E0D|nr:site-specific integrase [Sulfitobacter sp. D7]
MRNFEIGRLNGKYVVYWYEKAGDPDSRRRFRLKATNRAAALIEGERRFNAELALSGYKITLEDIWMRYQSYLQGRKTEGDLINAWKTIGPILGDYHPLAIDDEKVSKYLAHRKKQFFAKHKKHIAKTTLHNEVNLLQSTLNHPFKKNLIDKPVNLRKPKRKKRRDRWLTEDEIRRLLKETCKVPHLHIAVALLLGTAGRVSAILELTWDRVDFDARVIDLRVAPSDADLDFTDESHDWEDYRKSRAMVPMNDGLHKLLLDWKQQCDSDFVVECHGGPIKKITTSLRNAGNRAGIVGIHPHVLRHTAAVHMAANGSPMSKISQFLGHSSTTVTETVYARFAPDHLRDEAAAIDFLAK